MKRALAGNAIDDDAGERSERRTKCPAKRGDRELKQRDFVGHSGYAATARTGTIRPRRRGGVGSRVESERGILISVRCV